MTNSPGDGNGKMPQSLPETTGKQALEDQPPAEIIPPALDTALRTAGVDTRDPNVSKAIEISLMMYSGTLPLPPPPVLSAYNDAFPGLVEQIVSWTDAQREHRFGLERTRVERSENRLDLSQRNAFFVAVVGLVSATVASIFGSPWVAGIIAVVGVGGPAAAMICARQLQLGNSAPKERNASTPKRKASPPK